MRLHRETFRAMGSPCALHLYAHTPADARGLAAVCRAEVARLEAKYSRYRDDSLLSAINRSAGDPRGTAVDGETAALLDYAATAHRHSDGLFDVTSGVLRRAWDFRSRRLPARDQVAALLPLVGWSRVRWERPRLVLPRAGMELDFGGVVKEYAADRVAELCRARGVRHGLVDLGGDLAIVGPHPDGRPWRIGVRDPRAPERAIRMLHVARGGVATSGDGERCMIVDGVRYAHLLDPRSGWPVAGPASVTVLASHCLLAGTTSTTAMLSGTRGADRWLRAVGLPWLCVDADGRVRASPSLRNAEAAVPRRAADRVRRASSG